MTHQITESVQVRKICLIENKSKERSIIYSKKAGVMLMKEWIKYMMKKMLHLAFKRCNLHLFDKH